MHRYRWKLRLELSRFLKRPSLLFVLRRDVFRLQMYHGYCCKKVVCPKRSLETEIDTRPAFLYLLRRGRRTISAGKRRRKRLFINFYGSEKNKEVKKEETAETRSLLGHFLFKGPFKERPGEIFIVVWIVDIDWCRIHPRIVETKSTEKATNIDQKLSQACDELRLFPP